jgi:hypothetical protein
VTKRTPLEKFQAARLDAWEEVVTEAERTLRAETDPALSPNERLDIFMSLQAWPRIVLGLYRAELAIAQSDPAHKGEPSDIAYDVVGESLGLGPDRIRDLCREGRRHEDQGMPAKPKISATEFVGKVLRGRATPRRKRGTQPKKP